MAGFSETVKEHPELVIITLLFVAVLAYLSRSSGGGGVSSDDVTFTGGGVMARPVDPGVVAIEQSRIAAGSQNFGTLAQLYFGLTQSSNELAGYEYGVSAQRDVSLAGISAQRDVSLGQQATDIELGRIASTTQIAAANITADAQRFVSSLNAQTSREAIASQERTTLEGQATQRDVARVQAKSDFWGNVIGFAGDVVRAFNPFSWF